MSSDADRTRQLLAERPGASTYLDEALYERLLSVDRQWRDPGPPVDVTLAARISALLYRECRLLDDGRFEDWLGTFVPQCIYWIPARAGGADPRREITWELHDRRRLEDRIARLRTGHAYAQIPATRTRHNLSNMELWSPTSGEVRVRCHLTIHTWRDGVSGVLPCMAGYVLQHQPDNNWLVEIKQINLLDADHAQGNNAFLL